MLGCSFQAVEPRRSPLVPERTHEQLPRIAEGADERIHPDRLVADRHPHLAKIDMQLFARRRLKPHACPGLGTQRLAQWRHRALRSDTSMLSAGTGWIAWRRSRGQRRLGGLEDWLSERHRGNCDGVRQDLAREHDSPASARGQIDRPIQNCRLATPEAGYRFPMPHMDMRSIRSFIGALTPSQGIE